MDGNGNRLHLNFGYNDRAFNPAANNRAYPTTPSTFPQPIYQPQGGQEYMDPQAAYGQGYFANHPYSPQQAQYAQQQYQHNLQSPQPAYQSRMGYNDGTNGLIQQFSNQDLSASPRSSPYSRPRTAGNQGSGQQPGHLAPPLRSPKPHSEDEEIQRFPERYSDNVHKRGKAARELVNIFFQENIERARDRNMR